MGMTQHGFRTTPEFRSAIQYRAHDEGVTVSEFIRNQVQDYLTTEAVPNAKGYVDTSHVRFAIDQEIWDQARAKAHTEGTSISEVIRAQLENQML